MVRVYALDFGALRIRQRSRDGNAVASLHVHRSCRPDLVRLRMGNPAVGDGLPVDFSLPASGLAALSEASAAAPCHLAVSWLGFRIMIGAGLIKLRGDSCWRDLTCMYYHYETQPIPNPTEPLPSFCAALVSQNRNRWNHIVELVAPWFSFGPRTVCRIAGV